MIKQSQDIKKTGSGRPRKLLNQASDIMRCKHYSRRTEKTYLSWMKRYIFFHRKRHPKDMGVPEIETFLTHLAVKEKVSAATQNQAFNAILFLYREVLGISMEGKNIAAIRAKKKNNIPKCEFTGPSSQSICQVMVRS